MASFPNDARRRLQDAVAYAAAARDAQDAALRLTPLFRDIGWLEALTEELIAPLRTGKQIVPSIQTARHGYVLSLALATALPVRLMLTLIEGEAERAETGTVDLASQSVGFSGAQGLYRILSSEPVDALFSAIVPGRARCRTRAIRLQPGRWLMLDEQRRSLRIPPQAHPVLLMRARIERTPTPPVRRFSLRDGALVGAVQGDDGFARAAMLLSVLREAGARHAVPDIIGLLDRASGRERWTLMRELLALDAGAAWPHLTAMATQDPDAGVRAAAQAVLAAQKREAEPCPA